jgi:thymidylate synthase
MAWKTMVTELLWFLRGDTNIKYLVDNNCHIWDGDAYKNYLNKVQNYADSLSVPDDISEFKGVMDSLNKQIKSSVLTQEDFINKIKTDDEFAERFGNLGKIYGFQWRNWNGDIDQISELINQLKENPDSRRLLVSAWNPSDLPNQVLPPCHYGFQVYTRKTTREEKIVNPGKYRAISLMFNMRSCDTFLGLPFNIASYGLLLMMLANEVNMVPDELIGNLGDTHIYLNHIEQAKEQIGREPMELPTVHVRDGIFCSSVNDVILENYQSHPKIYFPLSN